jgi:hypothetical protein
MSDPRSSGYSTAGSITTSRDRTARFAFPTMLRATTRPSERCSMTSNQYTAFAPPRVNVRVGPVVGLAEHLRQRGLSDPHGTEDQISLRHAALMRA